MKSVKRYLHSHSALASLKRRLSAQKALKATVQKLLPSPLDEHIEAAVVEARTLTLWVNSPAWASRLRYLAPQLLRQLNQEGVILERIQPRVQVREDRKPSLKRFHRKLLLSDESAEALRHTAESLQDESLRDALIRLSRHTQTSKRD